MKTGSTNPTDVNQGPVLNQPGQCLTLLKPVRSSQNLHLDRKTAFPMNNDARCTEPLFWTVGPAYSILHLSNTEQMF